LAAYLKNDARVARVYFPGLAAGNEGSVAGRMLRAGQFGGLVSLELKDNTRDGAFRFMDALQLCVRSTSLGDIFTSALHPATASHRDLSPARRRELGISDGLIRISVGIENVQDISADIDQALNSAAAKVSEPGADQGSRAGSQRGVVEATGSIR
jgi:cystathionine beta-lyase/cystathionine gamma-synthase